MFTCQLCKKDFFTIKKLSSHLSHPKSSCKTNIKNYYDKYLRSDDEGLCIYCNSETRFYGLIKGYLNNKCKLCRNKGNDTQTKRKKIFKNKKEEKLLKNGYYDFPEVCNICNKRFETRGGLAKHISQIHKDIILKDYYDLYFKKENEGICLVTGEKTNFKNLIDGYYKYYKKGTSSSHIRIKYKKKQTLLKKYGVENLYLINSEKRITNYKKTIKEKKKLQLERIKFINLLKILSINKFNKLQCQICGKIFPNYQSISSHVKIHNIRIKKYYNLFFKDYNEGICISSNKETTFVGINKGYLKYKENFYNNPDYINNLKKSALNKTKKKLLKTIYKFNVKIVDFAEIRKITSLIQLQCLKCNNIYKNRVYNLQLGYGKCPICFPKNTHKSKGELEVYNFLKEKLSNETIYQSYLNLRNENNKLFELDIYIPNKKFAIEFNGLYWHSENVLNDPVNYHLNKTNICDKNGIRLIHIFEDEWYNKKDIIKKMLLHKLNVSNKEKIYARKCYINEIDPNIKNNFLNSNHIQGKDSSKIKLGLFLKETDALVSVMTFSGKNLAKGTINIKDTDWELNRFATDMNYIVIGAAGKLLNYFKKNYNWSLIFSYADLRYSNGDLYHKLGFKKVSQSLPNYWYVDNQGKRYYRFSLRKRPDEPKNIPEWKLRHDEGYYRIWDCGNLKFSIINPQSFV